ncbi:MAG: M20/M25/M40 family metallo-hydrolase [Bacteroidota bacterium]
MRKFRFSVLVLLLSGFISITGFAQEKYIEGVKKDIGFLASDSLKGRKPGTPEMLTAAKYISTQFQNAGLTLINGDGFQSFEVVTDVTPGNSNEFSFNSRVLKMKEDFIPYSFSENKALDASVVFAGYGFDFKTDSLVRNDYAGIDVKGKWVMLLRGYPESGKKNDIYSNYASDRGKVVVAKDKGAAGVLFVTGPAMDKNDELVSLFYDKSKAGGGIPVFNIKRKIADSILSSVSKTIAKLEKDASSENAITGIAIPTVVHAQSDLLLTRVSTNNVIGELSGSNPSLKDNYIVVGAHYDHLGMGGHGSGSRKPDTNAVHNGADDNASGVACIIDIANRFFKTKKRPDYSVIFVAFSGEELGMLGSTAFLAKPPVDKSKIKLMMNFDMVGRLNPKTKTISVSGNGTFKEAETLIRSHNDSTKMKITLHPEGYGPSDHAAFYSDNIPVLYFTTGVHGDYHTPEDDADKIDNNGVDMIAALAYDLLLDAGSGKYPMAFKEAGPKVKTSTRAGLKVTLGIMPDFTSEENKGLGVGGVTKDGPADHGGMKKGDVITAIDGKTVTNIYDYMERLKNLTPGQRTSVDIIRDGKKEILIIQL